VDDVAKDRESLRKMSAPHPELCPQARSQEDTCHDPAPARATRGDRCRIKLKASGEGFTLRSSSVLPALIARPEAVEKAPFLRQWGMPFSALAAVCGRKARCESRVWLSLGHPPRVSTTVKRADPLPPDLVAEEQIPWQGGEEILIPTTVGGGCASGISVAAEATSDSPEEASGECVPEAPAGWPDSQARSAGTAGFNPTREA
jgi:hypothetical protein